MTLKELSDEWREFLAYLFIALTDPDKVKRIIARAAVRLIVLSISVSTVVGVLLFLWGLFK